MYSKSGEAREILAKVHDLGIQGSFRLQSRPAIPREIVRAVLIEAGHRCAVCGVPCPLERAHIVPWCRKKSHQRDDLICLCANCHQRADLEQWGEGTLREYKINPWVNRQNNCNPQVGTTTRIELIIDMEITDFDEHQENMLRHALAGLLRISPQSVRVRSKEEGSVQLKLDLPEAEAKQLIEKFKAGAPDLGQFLSLFKILDIRELRKDGDDLQTHAEDAAIKGHAKIDSESLDSILREHRARIKHILTRYQIPNVDREDLVQEALVSTIKRWDKIGDPGTWLMITLRNRCVVYWRKRRSSLYNSVDTAILELLNEPVKPEEDREELVRDLAKLLESLPNRNRELLKLRGLGYDIDEVAKQMEIAPASARELLQDCQEVVTMWVLSKRMRS